ncbi:MAG: NAD(P)/FAD-dependent oxidoreductase [Candidatus Heimdallarchaeota archaeon]|nr:NAD(P)/FAD-dependent oxidoreductase [Candidatus Heimdallarchaeota archaeon]
MREADIVVIGGGPSGLIAARTAAERGKDVVLYESKNQIGVHEHCAGLLSIDGLDQLQLGNLPPEVVQNAQVKGTIIFSPSGQALSVSKKKPTVLVVNRAKLNQFLFQEALDKGVSVETSSRVIGIHRETNSLVLKMGKKALSQDIKCNIAILAEGRFPRLNEQVNLPVPSRKSIVFSSMYIMKNLRDIDPEFVEVYQDQKYAPGFFAWIIPLNDRIAKVGLASYTVPASDFLNSFIKNHPIAKKKLENAVIDKRMSGAIPLGSYIRKTYADNVLVVGDAAGQIKPTTGGGVIFGGIAAQIAGKVASDAVTAEKYNSQYLSKYQKLWKKELKQNLKVMKLIRSYINSLSTKDLNRFFILLNKPRIRNKISESGDVDNQKTIVFNLLMNLNLWPILLSTGLKFLLKNKEKKK